MNLSKCLEYTWWQLLNMSELWRFHHPQGEEISSPLSWMSNPFILKLQSSQRKHYPSSTLSSPIRTLYASRRLSFVFLNKCFGPVCLISLHIAAPISADELCITNASVLKKTQFYCIPFKIFSTSVIIAKCILYSTHNNTFFQ